MFHRREREINPLVSYNGDKVSYIDGIPTVLKRVHGNVAKGYIINDDMTTKECYIVKGQGYFSHGNSIKEAMRHLEHKILLDKEDDEILETFVSKFEKGKKYKGREFYEWHFLLTGSCKVGRDSFVANHGINLDNYITPEEFLNLVRGEYGWELIEKLEEYYD